jgi:hypothetical protein
LADPSFRAVILGGIEVTIARFECHHYCGNAGFAFAVVSAKPHLWDIILICNHFYPLFACCITSHHQPAVEASNYEAKVY